MAKAGKLGKLLKKMSFGTKSNNHRHPPPTSSPDNNHHLCPVYVGKSRRRYLVSTDVLDHPVFRQLAGKSPEDDVTVVGCEVVMFEHLLWMLENADPQPESLDELVDFYAC